MELPKGRKAKRAFWDNHVKQSQEFTGSIKQYCENNNINPRTFSYYKGRTQKSQTSKKTDLFSEVKLLTSRGASNKASQRLPDSIWLSQFLKELLR